MDEKEVIEAIVGLKKAAGRLKANGFKTAGHLDTAIEALEKQIAKKPVIYKGTNRADCPICGMTVRGIAKPFGGFCSKCGQRLDWGDSNA